MRFINRVVFFAIVAVPASAQFGSPQLIHGGTAEGARSVYATDLDGDGDADILSASQIDDKIAWHENLGGGEFGVQQVITTDANGSSGVYATDLDGDGDADVLSASKEDDKIAWYENLGGGEFGVQQVITTDASGASGVYATDLDGDGDADVLSASVWDDKIAWYENAGNGSFGPQQVITTLADGAGSVYAMDLDGDGDADVLSASEFDDKIVWYENLGAGDFGLPSTNQQVITTSADGAYSVYATDLDGDGDADALSASRWDDTIAWYENLEDGTGTASFGPQQAITNSALWARSVYATDLDGDGDADVLSASSYDDTIAWYENRLMEPSADFGSQQVINISSEAAWDVFATDLDGDGDAEVLLAAQDDDKIAWHENLGGGVFGPQQVLTFVAWLQAMDVYAADLDGDGDPDVLSAWEGSGKIVWSENLGSGSFGPQKEITTSVAEYAKAIYAIDIDGDGDMDVLSATDLPPSSTDLIAWYENLENGTGVVSFGPQQVITTSVDHPRSVYATDLDGDGDADVLSASYFDDKIAWYENLGGGVFGSQQIINLTSAAWSVYASDLDGDGDADVLSAAYGDDKIAWYENLGAGVFGLEQVVNSAAMGASDVFAADLDGDGDADVLSASFFQGHVAWYENLGGGVFGSEVVIDDWAGGVESVYAVDLDGDFDEDVLSVTPFFATGEVRWYENLGGGSFGPTQFISVDDGIPTGVYATDLDGDGDPDVLRSHKSADSSTLPSVVWYENLSVSQTTWSNLGHALGGFSGDPVLVGRGYMLPGESITLALSNAKPSAWTYLVMGITTLNVPFKGGVLVPSLDLLPPALPLSPNGDLSLTGSWPAAVPAGFALYFQHWIPDDAGPHGFAASNALSGETQ